MQIEWLAQAQGTQSSAAGVQPPHAETALPVALQAPLHVP